MRFIASKEKGAICLFGAPFDSTSSFRPGSRFGPQAIREASHGLETYSPVQKMDLQDISFIDAGDLELPFGDPAQALLMIEEKSSNILSSGAIPFLTGGEHLVTLGTFKAVERHYRDIRLVHLDAHADLREEYLGSRFSHATVIRRISETVGFDRIKQIGVRSSDRSEAELAAKLSSTPEEIIKWAHNSPIYLTCDLDILDPSIFPGTGTPEPGGITFNELSGILLKLINSLNIAAIDMVELCPMCDLTGTSSVVAAKLVRECLIAIGRKV
ncbi:MAG TPA: agmatinase [Desulfomonilia bacterium]